MKRTLYLISFLFLSFSLSHAAVFINEIMPRNVSYLINEDFNYEGWVELYNSGTQSVDVSNYYFSDDSNNLLKWKIQTTGLLQPGEFVVFYFDELDKPNHASFKLDPEGGLLFLSDSENNTIDQFSYIASHRNVSYGRKTNGAAAKEFFLQATPGKSNNGAISTFDKAKAPTFSLQAGFYSSARQVTIEAASGATIYYTLDGTEPQADKSPLYSAPIPISTNTPLRAIAVIDGILTSDITTATYFINSGSKGGLPVVSLVTAPDMLYSNEIGMLVLGKNGSLVPDYCAAGRNVKANYWNDWDRPCNFEFFDEAGKQQLNQEVKIGNFGACSRTKYVKSIKINTTKAHGGEGGNRLEYSLFQEKPNLKWKSIVLRNSGNDHGHSFLRDAFMQQIVAGEMDVDYQAYQPSVVFINGEYYGLLNIRERTNKDFIYSNYGLDEEEIDFAEAAGNSDAYWGFVWFVENHDMNTQSAYERIVSEVDLNEFLNYFIAQVYYANTDWGSGGNSKAWRRKENGKWRWILYDTDFGFSLYGNNFTTNSLSQNAFKHPLFAGFMNNDKIREQFITRFIIHLETTFNENRVVNLLNELSSYIEPDALEFENYLQNTDSGWKMELSGSWADDIQTMRTFAKQRPANIYKHLKSNFKLGNITPVHIHSNVAHVTYLLNDEKLDVSDFTASYFDGLELRITPVIPDGYRFKHWEIRNTGADVKIDTQLTYKEAFLGGDYKAVLEEDPDWQKPLLPKLYLNEICATNSQYIDEFSESDDWIELYNDEFTPVNIGGMFISDSKDDLRRYQIPDDEPFKTTIPAKGYLVIWADGQSVQGALHANFSLSNTARESVSLSQEINGNLHIIDSVSYKSHTKGETFARFSFDLAEDWQLTSRPTFLAPNVYAIPTTDLPSVFPGGESIVTIYPNPAVKMIWFSLPKYQTVNVSIMGMTGNCLIEHEISTGDGIDVSSLPSGLYVAVVHHSGGVQIIKFVKR